MSFMTKKYAVASASQVAVFKVLKNELIFALIL